MFRFVTGAIEGASGEVFIDQFRPTTITDGSDYIYISVKPKINDVISMGNTIISIEAADIGVSCIDDTDRIIEYKSKNYLNRWQKKFMIFILGYF